MAWWSIKSTETTLPLPAYPQSYFCFFIPRDAMTSQCFCKLCNQHISNATKEHTREILAVY